MTVAMPYEGHGCQVSKAEKKLSKKERAKAKIKVFDKNNNNVTCASSQDSKARKKCREKVFSKRPSLLTEMLRGDQYACLYNIFMAIVINVTAYTIASNLLQEGRLHLGYSNITEVFGKPGKTFLLLSAMHIFTYGPFYWTFRLWSDNRYSFILSSLESVWDLTYAIALGLYAYGFYYFPLQVQFHDTLPPASAAIIVMEQLRLTMKMYAFVRSNVPRVLKVSCDTALFLQPSSYLGKSEETTKSSDKSPSQHNLPYYLLTEDQQSGRLIHRITSSSAQKVPTFEQDQGSNPLPRNEVRKSPSNKETILKVLSKPASSPAPDFKTFLYFLFAPTLIYCDSYPRTDKIRWNFVFTTGLELLGCIYLYNLVHHLCGFTLIENFGSPGVIFRLPQILPYVFSQCIVGALGCVLGFYVLLHATQNIFSELLRFGDRQFYHDWWNSDSFSTYYRKWNIIVHDFLYVYIYKEAMDARLNELHKYVPAVLVFLVSSLFHEYIFIFVLKFFYPVLLIFFGGFGMFLSFVPNKSSWQAGNLFVWWSLITGCGLIHAFYTLEYFARKNGCPPASTPVLDFVIPRSWTCGVLRLWD